MARITLRRVAVTTAQYGVGLLAFAWLLGQVDVRSAIELLAAVGAETVAALVVVTLVGLAGRFYTWHVLINDVERTRFLAAASVDLIVNFVNQLLPSRLSGRVAAPVVLRGQTGMSYADAAAVSGLHTGLYAVLYGIASLIGLALGFDRLPMGIVLLLVLATGLYAVVGVSIILAGSNLTLLNHLVGGLERVTRRVPTVGERLAAPIDRLPGFTSASAASFRRLVADPGTLLAYAAGWTGAILIAPGVRVLLLLAALGTDFEPAILLPMYLVTAYSVTLLPLTPGGIGVTEATATAVFVALGVPSEVIVPVVFVDRFLGVYLPALTGWYPSFRFDFSTLVAE